MKKKLLICYLFAGMINLGYAQNSAKENVLERLLKSRPDLFGEILKNPQKYEVQLIYTQINRNAKNQPSFTTHTYGIDKNRYFYPASTAKFPIALLALEKLNKLNIKGLNKNTPMITGAARAPQEAAVKDSTSPTGLPSVAHYIKKLFVVSDNDAYNRLYEFLGQNYINETLWKKGYKDLLIWHRLSAPEFDMEANRYTNPVSFIAQDKIIYEQPEVYNKTKYTNKFKNTKKGKAYIKGNKLINEPFDFNDRNRMGLATMQEMLKAVMFPNAVSPEKRFQLTPDDYKFLYECMSILPRECAYPQYPEKDYPDGFVKFALYGDTTQQMDKHLRIFNKVGSAYGFLVENAYVVDFEAKTEFLLSGVIYVNADEVLNDSKYEYKEIGLPFFAHLGRVLAWHEKNRPRKGTPNLSNYKVDYK
jgi:hypothetical protein